MFQPILHVALGGAIGSVLRYLTYQLAPAPLGTLVVNVLGSFAIGVLFVVLSERMAWAPLLITGVLGGFTTFSAFSLDALKLAQAGQGGQAFAYVAGTLILSLAAVAAGAALARSIA